MRPSVQFLAKFILVSAVVFGLLAPLSPGYFKVLCVLANALLEVLDHPVRLEVHGEQVYLLYPTLFFPRESGAVLKILYLPSGATNYSFIVTASLFASTPRMPLITRLKGAAACFLLLSILHIAHVYYCSYLFVWDHVLQKRWLGQIDSLQFQRLVTVMERDFPRTVRTYLLEGYGYWTYFLREIAPLLFWTYFSYPFVAGIRRSPQNTT